MRNTTDIACQSTSESYRVFRFASLAAMGGGGVWRVMSCHHVTAWLRRIWACHIRIYILCLICYIYILVGCLLWVTPMYAVITFKYSCSGCVPPWVIMRKKLHFEFGRGPHANLCIYYVLKLVLYMFLLGCLLWWVPSMYAFYNVQVLLWVCAAMSSCVSFISNLGVPHAASLCIYYVLKHVIYMFLLGCLLWAPSMYAFYNNTVDCSYAAGEQAEQWWTYY